jgi:hypothetical protein
MPPYLQIPTIWLWLNVALSVAIGSVMVAGVLWLIARLRSGELVRTPGVFWVLAAFTMLGLVTGVLTGFSRVPVAGAVIPAVLTLVGGLAMYLVRKENNSTRVLVSASLIALAFTLLVGSIWGAVLREAYTGNLPASSKPGRPGLPPEFKPPGRIEPIPFPPIPSDSPFIPLPRNP